MNRGDIYRVSLDALAGHEQQGELFFLIASPLEFNLSTKLPVVVPIIKESGLTRRQGFSVPLVGTKTTGIVRCDRPRVLDVSARRGCKVESAPQQIIDEVLAVLATLFV